MLMFSRKRLEALMIGKDIKITVVEIRGDKVRLGIEAPKDVGVWRKELWDEMDDPKPKASVPGK